MQMVGTRMTYQIFAAVTLITGIFYFLFNYFYIERHGREIEKVNLSILLLNLQSCFLGTLVFFINNKILANW